MSDPVLDPPGCTVRQLPEHKRREAAALALDYNPGNRPPAYRLRQFAEAFVPLLTGGRDVEPAGIDALVAEHIAVVTTKYWGAGGVKLTVGFPFESTPLDLARRILSHMQAWGEYANVQFVLTNTDPQVRITRSGDGYWSYLGTDILSVPRNEPTMCLANFTMQTPESEYHRVVRHECGHCLGAGHEHFRQAIVARIDKNKAIEYFQRTQGWSAQVTQQQVLTPISEASIMGTPTADQDSIMCYFLPGSITTDGQPIRGGADINPLDGAFMGKLYPKPDSPTQPPPKPDGPDLSPFQVALPGFSVLVDPKTRTVKVVQPN